MVLGSFIKNPKGTRYRGEDADEKITYVFRKSFITTLPWLALSFIMAMAPLFFVPLISKAIPLDDKFMMIASFFWLLMTFGFFFVNFSNWFYNVYMLSNKKIIDMDYEGILFSNISEAPLDKIEDVTSVVKGTAETVFNYGTVYIQTAGESREFEFEKVDSPAMVRDLIADIGKAHRHRR